VDGALEDAEAALEFARKTAEPFNLFPALAFHARASKERGLEPAETSVAELLDGLAVGQPFWGAWSLPDLLGGVAADEQIAELKRVLGTARPHSRWYDAVLAAIDGDHARAADLYGAMGSQPDEAVARLRAGEQALVAGDMAEGDRQLARALSFFRRVEAHAELPNARTAARN
jgi:hypothetical protein